MINFRYHLVSLAALFFALAAGIALGAGPLRGPVDDAVAQQTSASAGGATSADVEALAAFEDGYADAVAPRMLKSRLADTSVAVVTLPDADSAQVKRLVSNLKSAGATVPVNVELTDKLLDPADRQFAHGVAQQSLDGVENVDAQGQSNYQLVGTALARAFLVPKGGAATFDAPAGTIASAFKQAGLVRYASDPAARAQVAVVVAGSPDKGSGDGQGELVATVADSMDAASSGVMVAGPTSSARGDGYVKAVRDSGAAADVSTIDVLDSPVGTMVSVVTLQQEASGTSGQYGAVGAADGAMPPLG